MTGAMGAKPKTPSRGVKEAAAPDPPRTGRDVLAIRDGGGMTMREMGG